MTLDAKAKGDRAELALVHWFHANGAPNVRRGKAGAEADLGDLFGVRAEWDNGWAAEEWTVQVTDTTKAASPAWVEAKAREAAEQAERAGTGMWVLIVKRPHVSPPDPGRWFAYLPAWAALDVNSGPWTREACEDLVRMSVRAWWAWARSEA